MDLKNILFLAQLVPNKMGTMEEFILLLSQALKERGYKCHLGFADMPPENIKKLFVEVEAKIHITNMAENSLYKKLKVACQLFKIIIKNKIDIVHTNFFGLTAIPMIGVYLSGARIVFTDHSSGKAERKSLFRYAAARCLHFFIKYRISKYIAVSNFVRDRMLITHHLKKNQCITIYNGINTARFKKTNQSSQKESFKAVGDSHTLLAVASHIPEKGLQVLIGAILLLKESGVNIDANFVGDGWYVSELKKIVVEYGLTEEIKFLGRRSDVHVLIGNSDVVVVPSLWEEAFGLIVAESMACGIPVVASRIGGIPELIEDGVSGYLFEPGNSEELALKIEALLNDKKKQVYLSEAALEKVKTHFDIFKQINAIMKVYESV